MADSTSDRPETPDGAAGDDAPRGAGGRRTGLQRLRASRSETAGDTTADDILTERDERPTSSERVRLAKSSSDRDRDGESSSDGNIAVLEPDETDSTVDAPDTPDAGDKPDSDKPRKRSRHARRKAHAAGARAKGDKKKPVEKGPRAAGAGGSAVPGRLVALALVLALLVIGLAIPVVAKRHNIIGQSAEERSAKALLNKRDVALATGRRFAVDFFTVDYRRIDDYNKEILSLTTGDFNKDFASRAGQVKSLTTQVKSIGTGSVLAAGVRRVSGPTVYVLAVVDQNLTTDTPNAQKATKRYRIEVTLQQTPQGWLVSGLSPVL